MDGSLPFPHLYKDASTEILEHLRDFAKNLITKDPRLLTPDERDLLGALNQQYEVQQGEVNHKSCKQADTPDDDVMRSPTPAPQTPRFCQPPFTSDTEPLELKFCEAFDPENAATELANPSSFFNVRHSPYTYTRPDINGSSFLGRDEIPRWVKRAAKRKAPRPNMLYKEGYLGKEALQVDEFSQLYDGDLRSSRIKANRIKVEMLKLLHRVKADARSAGTLWDDDFFLETHIDKLWRCAEGNVA